MREVMNRGSRDINDFMQLSCKELTVIREE